MRSIPPALVRRYVLLFAVGTLLALVIAAGWWVRSPAYHYVVSVRSVGDIRMDFLGYRGPLGDVCLAAAESVAKVIEATCPECTILTRGCLEEVDLPEKELLSGEPLSIPSLRTPDGVVGYRSADPALALAACREAERLVNAGGRVNATCDPPGIERHLLRAPREMKTVFAAAIVLLLGALGAFLAGMLILRYDAVHLKWTQDHVDAAPQRFHALPTPRVGGVCLLMGLLAVQFGLAIFEYPTVQRGFGFLMLAALPAFLGGIVEDLTKNVRVLTRLGFTMASAACAVWLFDAPLDRVDVAGLDALLRWLPFGIAFTIFAVGGVTNAVNIIDGYNGLAAGFSVMVLAAIAYVSVKTGDRFLLLSSLAMAGALTGFLFWNWPRGRIFLGDGGAYFVGFWLAQLSVLLVVRHREVSAWFPLVLLIYPVFETFFSVYRKRIVRGNSPAHPDGLHLHMLIFRRMINVFVRDEEPRALVRRNSMVAPRIWASTLCFIVPAVVFWADTAVLATLTVVFCLSYVWLYRRLVRWKTPVWMVARRRRSDRARDT